MTSSGCTRCRPRSNTACSPASLQTLSTSFSALRTTSSMRVGWMRPSATSAEIARRAISRRTGLKHEIVIDSAVSSMIMSMPVAASSARMLRPSRPISRPFEIVRRQRHDGDGALVHELAREPLDRRRDDRLRARGRLRVRVVLDLLDLDGGLTRAPGRGPRPRAACAPAPRDSPAICLELLARVGLRGLRLLDRGVGLLDLAVDATSPSCRSRRRGARASRRVLSTSRSLRCERLLALLQLAATRRAARRRGRPCACARPPCRRPRPPS